MSTMTDAATPAPAAQPLSLEALAARVTELESQVAGLAERVPENRVSLVVLSGDLDKVLASFIIATGAASLGMEVTMFFTFWGLNAIKTGRDLSGKNLMESMMSLMTPSRSQELNPSHLSFFGAGAMMMRQMMKSKNVASLEELMGMTGDLGIQLIACEMSMDIMGIKGGELLPDTKFAGVATFVDLAVRSRATLFI
jgi:peroxiredoxin family protein